MTEEILQELKNYNANENIFDANNKKPLDYLNKKDLWPLNLIENYMDVIEKGINDLKEFNFLVQQIVLTIVAHIIHLLLVGGKLRIC